MKFRFDRYPDKVIVIGIDQRVRGLKHIDQRPTSVEFAYKELRRLIATDTTTTSLMEIVSALEVKEG